jgi:hypothetical protein
MAKGAQVISFHCEYAIIGQCLVLGRQSSGLTNHYLLEQSDIHEMMNWGSTNGHIIAWNDTISSSMTLIAI